MHTTYVYLFCLNSDLAGTNVGSPRLLGVGGNASNYARRKSDSRLDSSQIAHLQKVYAASYTFIDQLGLELEIGTTNQVAKIEEAAGIEKGAGESSKGSVGNISKSQLEEIAKTKLPDLNCTSVESAMKVIEGTARNMGVSITE